MTYAPTRLGWAGLSFLAASFGVTADSVERQYSVCRVEPDVIVVDGQVDDASWEFAHELKNEFHYPWRDEVPPKTSFRAVHDMRYLYFVFLVEDPDIVYSGPIASESDIQHEDRVELFFATNTSAEADMSGSAAAPPCCYYGLEIDSGGRVMDFSGTFGQSIDRAWTMSSLETVGSRTQTGYRVEGRMQLQQLRDMDVLDELGFMRVGVYRGEYSGDPKADSPKWISWIDPGTELPNFHTIAAFGVFELR